ncbi:hypothetical protein TCAL_15082 [Tigriopus californicus]|uniref:Uncharacterized protein n=1 Tax=Tigriopus californicus TaxID=6832 RepID=A0A553NTE1_TIGCA|nr:hypothetical protein TCAL_15082 [Tigriopus californicus]
MNGSNFDAGVGVAVESEVMLKSIHLCSTDSVPSSAATLSQLEPSKYIISHSGPMGTSSQQSTAAAFFARTRSKQHGFHSSSLTFCSNNNNNNNRNQWIPHHPSNGEEKTPI